MPLRYIEFVSRPDLEKSMKVHIESCACCENPDVYTKPGSLSYCPGCENHFCINHSCECPVTIRSADEFEDSFGFRLESATFPMMLSSEQLNFLLT
jgi:hypothetical protein